MFMCIRLASLTVGGNQKSSEPQALQTVDIMEGKSTNFTEYSIYLYAVWWFLFILISAIQVSMSADRQDVPVIMKMFSDISKLNKLTVSPSLMFLNCTASLYAPLSSFNFIFSISKNRLICFTVCKKYLGCDVDMWLCADLWLLHLFLSPLASLIYHSQYHHTTKCYLDFAHTLWNQQIRSSERW